MNNFAGDTKPTQNMARSMMRMVGDMTAKVPEAVGKPADQAAGVTCAMCDRGAPAPGGGAPAASPAGRGS